jgi:small subunit ribosomal protein S18
MEEGEGTRDTREKGRRFVFKPKACQFCVDKTEIDYKDISRLRRYISDRARIQPRRRTGICAKHQRRLALAIKRARYLALLPYTPEHVSLGRTSETRA